MSRRLLSVLACALVLLAGAAPAFADAKHPAHHHHRHHTAKAAATSSTTTSSSSTTSTTSEASAGSGRATRAEGTEILNDCQAHGQLTRAYTRAELQKARSMISAATGQYSDCENVIDQALIHSAKGGGSGGSGGGSSTTVIVIIIVVVLVLLAGLIGGLALRRRRGGGGSDGGAATAT